MAKASCSLPAKQEEWWSQEGQAGQSALLLSPLPMDSPWSLSSARSCGTTERGGVGEHWWAREGTTSAVTLAEPLV